MSRRSIRSVSETTSLRSTRTSRSGWRRENARSWRVRAAARSAAASIWAMRSCTAG
ncbi:MAG: hypothetical protein U0599_02565 [Vicinamibacteria bacterium]